MASASGLPRPHAAGALLGEPPQRTPPQRRYSREWVAALAASALWTAWLVTGYGGPTVQQSVSNVGLTLVALEGSMDPRVAGVAADTGGATARLAQAAAARAFGSAVAVGAIPQLVAAGQMGRLSLAVTVPLVLCGALALLTTRGRTPIVAAASGTLPIDWWAPDDARAPAPVLAGARRGSRPAVG